MPTIIRPKRPSLLMLLRLRLDLAVGRWVYRIKRWPAVLRRQYARVLLRHIEWVMRRERAAANQASAESLGVR